MHGPDDMMDDDKDYDYKKSDKSEPSAKDALEGRLGDMDKLVMLLLTQSQQTPPSPMGSPLAGTPPSPSPALGGPPPMPMGAMTPPPPMMGAGGPMGMPPMGGMNPMMQQLQAARGLV